MKKQSGVLEKNVWTLYCTEKWMAPRLEDINCEGWDVLTMYSERGGCFRLPNHVFYHACIGALIWRGHLANNQGMVLQDFKSGGRTDTHNQEMKGEVGTPCLHGKWLHVEALCVLPALRQVRIVFSPADSGNRVSLNHTVELHALICQHHYTAGPLHKGRTLWRTTQ